MPARPWRVPPASLANAVSESASITATSSAASLSTAPATRRAIAFSVCRVIRQAMHGQNDGGLRLALRAAENRVRRQRQVHAHALDALHGLNRALEFALEGALNSSPFR